MNIKLNAHSSISVAISTFTGQLNLEMPGFSSLQHRKLTKQYYEIIVVFVK